MSVKRASECERALKVLKSFKIHIMEELPLNVATYPPTHQSPLLGTTNQVGNKIDLLRNNNPPIKSSFPMQVPSAHAL
jgi:hypothetical protein